MRREVKESMADGWLESKFSLNPGDRMWSWKMALGIYLQTGGGTILETGCQRMEDDWGAGCSTLIFANLINDFQCGDFYSVDLSAENIALSQKVLDSYGLKTANLTVEDSLKYLSKFTKPVDFLYLDSYDWYPDEPGLTLCQAHQLEEMKLIYDKLTPKALVLLDDNRLPGGGKTRLTKEFLADNGWTCLFDWQHSLWARPESLRLVSL